MVVAIGIIGATVMPHNLYLHSALVQSRKLQGDELDDHSRAIRFNTIDTVVALSLAFFVNAAILVLAAMVFHGRESRDACQTASRSSRSTTTPTGFASAYLTLAPLLGTALASTLFAVALLRQRPEQHHHRHAGRPGGHGRVHALAHQAVGAPADDAAAGHPPGHAHHRPARRRQRHRSAGPQPGRAGPATAVRHVPAAALHQFAQADGPTSPTAGSCSSPAGVHACSSPHWISMGCPMPCRKHG